ncbi:MAG TPA: hypothetical protein VMS89_04010 [Methanoregulaceae archaeon]|nr:hypothetical protein [Methanoregulaceae archaeon]
MPEEQQKQAPVQPRGYGFIPAGALIGLGVGILIGYPASGVLIGLGFGFFGSAIISHAFQRRGWPFSGLIFIIIGAWFFFFPYSAGYLAAIVAIILGLLFLVRGFARKKFREH